jgi:hypothetical protein
MYEYYGSLAFWKVELWKSVVNQVRAIVAEDI